MKRKVTYLIICMLLTTIFVSMTAIANRPPEKPDTPSGPTEGETEVYYTYTTRAIEPDGDQVWYKWIWGDGSYPAWKGPYEPNVTIEFQHRFRRAGEFQIFVFAKDSEGATSPPSDKLTVNITEAPQPELQIDAIVSGIFLTAEISNIGEGDAFDVKWSFSIKGGLKFGPFKGIDIIEHGKIPMLISGGMATICCDVLPLGIGRVQITVTAKIERYQMTVTKEINGLALIFGVVVMPQ